MASIKYLEIFFFLGFISLVSGALYCQKGFASLSKFSPGALSSKNCGAEFPSATKCIARFDKTTPNKIVTAMCAVSTLVCDVENKQFRTCCCSGNNCNNKAYLEQCKNGSSQATPAPATKTVSCHDGPGSSLACYKHGGQCMAFYNKPSNSKEQYCADSTVACDKEDKYLKTCCCKGDNCNDAAFKKRCVGGSGSGAVGNVASMGLLVVMAIVWKFLC